VPRETNQRALSLTNPWAHAVAHLGKRVENRTAWKSCSYRGQLWIHASATAGKSFDECAIGLRDALAAQDRVVDWTLLLRDQIATKTIRDSGRFIPREAARFVARPTLPMGAIVAHARLVDVIRDDRDFLRWQNEARTADENRRRASQRAWWFGGFALVLDDVIPVEPVSAKGALGLWHLPAKVAELAADALEKAGAA
jgi:hypothetical protein